MVVPWAAVMVVPVANTDSLGNIAPVVVKFPTLTLFVVVAPDVVTWSSVGVAGVKISNLPLVLFLPTAVIPPDEYAGAVAVILPTVVRLPLALNVAASVVPPYHLNPKVEELLGTLCHK
jgi:hypothetical protein